MILTLKTDNPVAEIGLYREDGTQLSYYTWRADRQLAKDLFKEIKGQLDAQKADWPDVRGLVVFKGPGSFTGLRIGITVVNTLAYSASAPIIAAEGEDWIQQGLDRLQKGENDRLVLPHYGADAHITLPKK
jgi:tRNA threonylcarbamoyladenosine biosynthesis protein TsaB